MIMHNHIPKTAGGSLLSILRLQYGEELLPIPARDWEDVTPAQAREYAVISGHVPYGIAEARWGLEDVRHITFLRDPVARVASLYGYILRRGGGHCAYEYVSRMTPQEFAEHGPFDNCQVRMLAGRQDFQWFQTKLPVTAADLAQAEANLDACWFVGDVAHFRADVYRLGDRLNWTPFAVPHINASLSKPRIEMTDAFMEKWCYDLAFYSRWSARSESV